MKYYFIFGEAAVTEYDEKDTLQDYFLKTGGFELYEWDNRDAPENLLNAFDGWYAYISIPEEKYLDIKKRFLNIER